MIGTRLARYKIVDQIGAGGMGVVYRARDERLGRDVALKVLPTGALVDDLARRRFRKEALTLSQLNHPSIATIHDFDSVDGIEFLVMELIAGVSLDEKVSAGPLPERETVSIGLQVVQGLVAAHQNGIIHRDLKPSNLRFTPDQRVKILDFGVAQLIQHGDVNATLSTTSAPGAGTVPYMAPEQLRDDVADPRTDIYSLGAVLYELATGRRPFTETHGPRLIDAIFNKQPPLPRELNKKISPGLDLVIQKAMDKDPARRYQTARELQVDLERLSTPTQMGLLAERRVSAGSRKVWIAAALLAAAIVTALVMAGIGNGPGTPAGPPRITSIAVLPLENLSGDASQEYFADGVTDALVNELTRIRALRVISRWSVMRYKGTGKPPREIAKDLNVDGLVVGSVVRAGDRVQVRVQLIHPATDANLWANRYEGDLRDVLGLQSELVGHIVQELHVQLTSQEQARLAQRRPVTPEAHDAYLQGRFQWGLRTQQGYETAMKFFQQAIEKDAKYAPAYAGLADTYTLLRSSQLWPPEQARPRAKAAALKALELDESLAEGHTSLAAILYDDREFAEAERRFQRALELNPGYPTALHWYALYLAGFGRYDEALPLIRKAQERDPYMLIIRSNVGFVLYLAGRYPEAAAQCQSVLAIDSKYDGARGYLAQIYLEMGRFDEALREMQASSEDEPAELGYAYAVAGRPAEARRILQQLLSDGKKKYVSPYDIAVIYTGLDERDEAFRWLDRAVDERNVRLLNVKVHPRFAKLRGDPRFQKLLERMGFPK